MTTYMKYGGSYLRRAAYGGAYSTSPDCCCDVVPTCDPCRAPTLASYEVLDGCGCAIPSGDDVPFELDPSVYPDACIAYEAAFNLDTGLSRCGAYDGWVDIVVTADYVCYAGGVVRIWWWVDGGASMTQCEEGEGTVTVTDNGDGTSNYTIEFTANCCPYAGVLTPMTVRVTFRA